MHIHMLSEVHNGRATGLFGGQRQGGLGAKDRVVLGPETGWLGAKDRVVWRPETWWFMVHRVVGG